MSGTNKKRRVRKSSAEILLDKHNNYDMTYSTSLVQASSLLLIVPDGLSKYNGFSVVTLLFPCTTYRHRKVFLISLPLSLKSLNVENIPEEGCPVSEKSLLLG